MFTGARLEGGQVLTYVNYFAGKRERLKSFVCAHKKLSYLCTRFQITTGGFYRPKVKV
jgi:hypothetical protein